MLSHPANKAGNAFNNNKPIIGRLFLTPVNDVTSVKGAPNTDGGKMPTATLLLEASRLAQQQLHLQNDKALSSDNKKKFGNKDDFKSISEIDDDPEEKHEVFV